MAKVVLEKVYKSFPSRTGQPDDSTEVGVAKTGGASVLRCIDLTVKESEFLVLVGPSGCGKSTLLRTIAGLEEVTAGNIWVGDRVVNDLPPKERDIAMVFQSYALYPHLSVYDNIAFGLRRRNWDARRTPERFSLKQRLRQWGEPVLEEVTRSFPKGLNYHPEREAAIARQVREVARLLQIEPLLQRRPKQLSGGQKQRVALGRAIARNPQVFLMDEPLSNLDAALRAQTRTQIVQLQKRLGITTLYVTHDQTEAMTMGDRIAVMNRGEIQQVAKPLELYNHPANRFVAEFIGSPPMNFLPVQWQPPLLIVHPQFRLTLPESWGERLQGNSARSLLLGIRPEHLSLSPAATKNLCVTVDIVEALGNDTYIAAHLAKDTEARLQVRIPPDTPVTLGESLWLSMTLDKIHLFDPQTSRAI
ncbi:ABC transporter ATP-binding protein [Lusitaniella coriacea]|uniref:ABC transporter ATP-binding protein n=1 Tax=Lusitaniella coriacea TaxID=1983105 RepID=UPI003CF64A2E